MRITDRQIEEFQVLYEKEFGEKISKKEAYEKGSRLAGLVQVVYKPSLKENSSEIEN